ncbi:hypothetical protein [Planococcus antarcticus]|uniref:hypothetical protein n=1 Tax=Planococcus antarcticus TaxID=161360 RepID=UPI0012B5DBEB|nr:hypothetical protein [Planococcus antarcticus]
MRPHSPDAESLKTELQMIVVDQIGKKSNMNKERVNDISASRGFDGWNVELALNADKGFTMISTRQQMWQHAITILELISKTNQLDDISISWIYPVKNNQNDVEDKSVMSFSLDKATRDQLIWANLDPSILPNMTLDYLEHPVLNN